jgi:hypothetical protein
MEGGMGGSLSQAQQERPRRSGWARRSARVPKPLPRHDSRVRTERCSCMLPPASCASPRGRSVSFIRLCRARAVRAQPAGIAASIRCRCRLACRAPTPTPAAEAHAQLHRRSGARYMRHAAPTPPSPRPMPHAAAQPSRSLPLVVSPFILRLHDGESTEASTRRRRRSEPSSRCGSGPTAAEARGGTAATTSRRRRAHVRSPRRRARCSRARRRPAGQLERGASPTQTAPAVPLRSKASRCAARDVLQRLQLVQRELAGPQVPAEKKICSSVCPRCGHLSSPPFVSGPSRWYRQTRRIWNSCLDSAFEKPARRSAGENAERQGRPSRGERMRCLHGKKPGPTPDGPGARSFGATRSHGTHAPPRCPPRPSTPSHLQRWC